MEDDPLQRLAALRRDEQAARRPAGGERLLDRPPTGDELLARRRASGAAAARPRRRPVVGGRGGRTAGVRAGSAVRAGAGCGGPAGPWRPRSLGGAARRPGRRRRPAGESGGRPRGRTGRRRSPRAVEVAPGPAGRRPAGRRVAAGRSAAQRRRGRRPPVRSARGRVAPAGRPLGPRGRAGPGSAAAGRGRSTGAVTRAAPRRPRRPGRERRQARASRADAAAGGPPRAGRRHRAAARRRGRPPRSARRPGRPPPSPAVRGRRPSDRLEPPPALAVAGVLDRDAERGELVAQPVRRGPVAARARGLARVEQLGGAGRQVGGLVGQDRRGRDRGRAGAPARARRRPSTATASAIRRLSSRTRSNSGRERGRDVQVVVERGLEPPRAPRRAPPARSASSGASSRVGLERRRRARRAARSRPRRRRATSSVYSSACAVVDRDQRVAQGPRRDARLEQVGDPGDVADVDLAIFAPPSRRWAQCSQVRTNGWPVAASLWAISSSWCGKIRSTPPVWMSNDWPEVAPCSSPSTRCASPAGPARSRVSHDGSPGFGPFQSAKSRTSSLPYSSASTRSPTRSWLGIEPGEAAVRRPRRDPEEDRAVVGPVGVAALEERLRSARPSASMCSVARGRTSGRRHAQRRGVGEEPLEPAVGELADRDARRVRAAR